MKNRRRWLIPLTAAVCSSLITALLMSWIMKPEPPPLANYGRNAHDVTLISKEDNREWVIFQSEDGTETWRTQVTLTEYYLLNEGEVYGGIQLASYDHGETYRLLFASPYPKK